MKPQVDQILNLSAGQLMSTITPLVPEGYAQGTTSLIAFMMILAAQEYERAADIRVSENADMRALFAELAPGVHDAALKAKLEAVAKTQDTSLTISALDGANYELRRLLIALHEHVEAQEGANRRVWSLLKRLAARRVLKLPMQ